MKSSRNSLTAQSLTVLRRSSHSVFDTTGAGGLVDIEVSVIAGRGLRYSHKFRNPSFSVQLTLDSETKNTDARQSEDDAVTWNTDFVFSATIASSMKIRVYCKHQRFGEDHVVGEASFEVLSMARNKEIEIELHLPDGVTRKRSSSAFLKLHLKAARSVMFSIQHDAETDLRSASFLKQMERIVGSISSDKFKELPSAWIRLFSSLYTFSSLAQAVAELDSRAKVAVGAVAFAIKVLVDQIKRDEKIDNLGRIMCDLYAYVIDGCSIRKIISFEKTLQRLLTQTAECAYFITDYQRISVFTQRAIVNLMSNADTMISNFEAAFGELKIALVLGSSLQTALVSYRVLQTVVDIENLIRIEGLPFLEDVGWDSQKICLRGTRQKTINTIIGWASGNLGNSTSSSHVYLLSGPIACGKSTIAHSIAKMFHEQNRLGAAIFLHDEVAGANAKRISASIVHQLAGYDTSLYARIAAKIKEDQSLRRADVRRQFRALAVQTSRPTDSELVMVGPVLIIIDGLDGLNDEEQHKLLTTIVEESGGLPSNFRILLTCRNGNIVAKRLLDRLTNHVHVIGFGDTETGNDVSTIQYLSQSLADIFSKDPHLSTQYQLDELQGQLAKKSRGMHFWVSTFCRSLLACKDDKASLLLAFLSLDTLPLSNDDAVDLLYRTLFKVFFPDKISARHLFHIMIQSQQFMTWIHLLQFAFYTPQPAKLNGDAYTARKLGLIIEEGQDENGIPLFGIHPTLEDFLTNPHRSHGSGVYVERGSPLDRSAAEFCLRIMNESLRYNICNIEDIMIVNAEITDKDSRVEQYIPNSLRYACCNWTLHLEREDNLNLDEALFQQLHEFVLTHMLHWIEAMSLLGRVDDIQSSLFRFSGWAQKRKIRFNSNRSDIVYTLTTFAAHFVKTFSAMISKAALQTYIYALTLMPSDTVVFRQLSNGAGGKFMSNLDIKYGWNVSRASLLSNTARSSCYNSQCALIALGPRTGGVCFQDARTGAYVPCRITIDEEIEGLSFSSDGADLATITASGQFAVYTVKTGMCVYSSSTDLSQGAFITYSNDGTTILAVSKHRETAGGTIDCYVYNTPTGYLRLLPKTLPIRNPSKIALSPDGRRLAIPSEVGIELFDLDTGENLGVIANHLRFRCAVTWSPDAAFMAVVSLAENTIYLWSFRAGNRWKIDIDDTSNSAAPCALNFSLDSSRIAFAWSYPNGISSSILKVQIWDTETAKQIGEATINEGPIRCITRRLSFVPDGQEIVILSEVYHRSDGEYQTLVYLLSDTSPAYMTSPSTFRDFKPAPTVSLSFSGKGERSGYPPTDTDGWVTTSAGRRIFMVPYPNFDVLSSPSPLSSTYTCLDIIHPGSKKTVLKCVINWNEKTDSNTEARDVVSTTAHPNTPIRLSLLTHHLRNMH